MIAMQSLHSSHDADQQPRHLFAGKEAILIHATAGRTQSNLRVTCMGTSVAVWQR